MTKYLKCQLLLILMFNLLGLKSQSIFKDCTAGEGNGEVIYLGQNDKGFFFMSNDQTSHFYLWFSDGTDQGTKIIQQFALSEYRYSASQFVIENNQLIVLLSNYSLSVSKLWISDGTDTGTHNLGDFGFAVGPDLKNNVKWYKNKYYFLLHVNNLGPSLWVSDGRNRLEFLKDIDTSSKDNDIQLRLRLLNNKLYFFANHTDYGTELWTSDGTDTGTHLELDILPGTESGINGSCFLHVFKNKLYFNYILINNNNFQLSSYDVSSKNLVNFFNDDSIKTYFSVVEINYKDDSLMFINCKKKGKYEVWVSDGTKAKTKKIRQSQFSTTDEYLNNAYNINGKYIINSFISPLGYELWNYDETTQEYSLIKDLNPGTTSTNIFFNSVIKNNKLYFIAASSAFGIDVWVTDGTFDGTILYNDINNNGYFVSGLISFNDKYFISGLLDSTYGTEIYNFDQLNTSVHQLDFAKTLKIYPHPAHAGEIVNIQTDAEIREILLFDLHGRQQKIQHQNNQIFLNDNIQAGLYNLIVTDMNGAIFQIKLIIH